MPVKSTQERNFWLGDRVDGISCSYGKYSRAGRKGVPSVLADSKR